MVRTELVIASGETEIVASGEVQDTATVSNAGTFENAGTNTAGGQELTTLSTDIDASTSTLSRVRTLTSTATDIDASSGTLLRVRTLTTDATDIDATTATLTRIRSLTTTSTDIDQGTVDLFAGTLLAATATDVDQGSGTISVAVLLSASATDVDQGTSTLSRLRELTANATDVDNGEGVLFTIIPLESERAVASIKEILDNPEISDYRNQEPTVLNYWDRTQQERGPGADQPAEIYVWETAGKDIERFSLDDDSTHDTASVEALVYSLDEQAVIDYAEDARNNIEQFFDDNKEASSWQTIEVTSVNDFREQTQRRSTDQYVVSLEIELEKIQSV